MKKNILTILFFTSCIFSYAQRELWGNNKTQSYIDYSNPANPVTYPYFGNITKYDINGENPSVVHVFNGVNGKLPTGKLFQASNGKLYGMTSTYSSSTGQNDDACLFEYDLILNKFRIVHTFDHTIYHSELMESGVIEGTTGKLYGSIGTYFFCYTIATETTTMHVLNNYFASLSGELVKASDNFLYGCIFLPANPCPNISSIGAHHGMIIKINPLTNTSLVKYAFNCDVSDGTFPTGGLIEETPNVLTSSAMSGGLFYNAGTIFEYNIQSNTFTKKQNLDGEIIGAFPQAMAKGNNGKLYGVCTFGGTTITQPNNYFNYYGSIFEYTPATNAINKLYNFPNGGMTSAIRPKSIMRASTGLFFGTYEAGIFRFNPIDNTSVTPCFNCPLTDPNAYVTESLIEICRKPSYQEFVINTFNSCVGDNFSFNVQNTNATSYIWKKNNIDLPTQNSGILNLVNVTTNDNGTYTCQMVNECGTTVTMPLQLTVNCLGTDDFVTLDKSITLFPNPTNNILNIKIYENRNVEISKIEITNLLGQIVFSEEKSNTKIDVSKFQSGIYLLKLTTNKGSWSGKFIKE